MNKYFIIILLTIFASFDLKAQEDKPAFIPEHLIGFTGGVNMVSIFSEGTLSYTDASGNFLITNPYLIRKNAGLSYKYISGKNIGLLLESSYSQKGGYNEFMFDVNGNVTDSTLVNHQADYIDFSFLTNVRLGKKHSKINLYLGPHLSYLYKQNIIFIENTYGREFVNKTDIKFEYGINIGGAYSFNFNKGEVELRFLYIHDFSNIFKEKTVNNFSFNQNQVYQLNLSYYYKFKRKNI